ncbi:hypothetical protein Cgig2_005948 [Carnegiea gigantea]|uniref:EF-hand domain-containing protein n=1 Tax=Carnegiea gigantea TaxID=171969 RepID=A0A9Q1KKE4_9CARY|nr:hypothetical protein Cgig2_005948 [Carnegiea gigantea]
MIHSSAMSPLNTADIHQTFASLDQNGDGLLTLDELNWLLERTGVHVGPEELVSLVGETGLSLEEFSHFYETMLNEEKSSSSGGQNGNDIDEEGEILEEEQQDSDLYRAFEVFDLNGDGLISSQELQSVLSRLGMWDNNGGLDCDRIMHKYDVNSDGFFYHSFVVRHYLCSYHLVKLSERV